MPHAVREARACHMQCWACGTRSLRFSGLAPVLQVLSKYSHLNRTILVEENQNVDFRNLHSRRSVRGKLHGGSGIWEIFSEAVVSSS